MDLEDIKKHCKVRKEKTNLTMEELGTLKELNNNKNIVIKPADKGNSVEEATQIKTPTTIHFSLI